MSTVIQIYCLSEERVYFSDFALQILFICFSSGRLSVWNRVLINSPGFPQIHFIAQADLQFTSFQSGINKFTHHNSHLSITLLVGGFALRRIFAIIPNRSKNNRTGPLQISRQLRLFVFYTGSLYIVLGVLKVTM